MLCDKMAEAVEEETQAYFLIICLICGENYLPFDCVWFSQYVIQRLRKAL